MKKNKILKYLILYSIFLVGIFFGLFLWDKITLPFENPWGVVGSLTLIQYNPANNIIRFIVLILSPIVLLVTFYLLNFKKLKNTFFIRRNFSEIKLISTKISSIQNKILAALLILLSILFLFNNSPHNSSVVKIDTFHDGETLGAAVSYLEGKVPYKDFIFCHGLLQDPIRSIIAFKLFGKAIGSVWTLETIFKIITAILLAIYILISYRKNYVLAFTAILLLLFFSLNLQFLLDINPAYFLRSSIKYLFSSFPLTLLYTTRDITTYSFLITISLLQKYINDQEISIKKFFLIIFLFSFIPIIAFSYSIDRGFYLFATYLIISPILYFFIFRKSRLQNYYLLSSLIGIISAIILLLKMLQGDFFKFFNFTFLIIPKYKELLDGFVYPIFTMKFLLVCILIAANTYWITFKFIQEYQQNNKQIKISIKRFIENYLIEICLLLISIFFFRSALGRSDWWHVMYSIHITYILSIYILLKHYLYKYSSLKIVKYVISFVVVSVFTFFIYRTYKNDLITKSFPLKIEDSKFIPDNYKATISYLKNNLSNEEEFFTMTSEASWYYFIEKPCPTRFPVVWFAAPYFYQEEIINDLESKNVKFILYKNDHWANKIDKIDNEKRLPIIINYIKNHYVFHKKIDDQEIWINKLYNQ